MTLKDVIKTENIIKASLDDNLSTALGHLSSSHDAVFIFDEKGRYKGIISPYYCVIRTQYPGKTKVQNCLYHPPKIHLKDTMAKVAQSMADSKVHYLPIFNEKEEFIGITTARRILKHLLTTNHAKKLLIDLINEKNGGVVSVSEDDNLHKALELYKEYKISKLVVIDKNMKVKGILSYYDLMPYLVAPGGKQQRATNVNEKETFLNKKVKNYSQKTILTCERQHTVADAINSILTHNMGSVIVKDNEGHPIGILTTRDILNLLRPKKKKKPVTLTIKKLSPEYEKFVNELLYQVRKHVQNNENMRSGRILIHEEKKGVLFRIAVYLTPIKGTVQVTEKEGKNIEVLVKDIKKALNKKQQ